MKKYIALFILLFFCFGFSSPHSGIIARKNASGGGGCDTATNEVGDRSEESGTVSLNADIVLCYLSSADCTGTLYQAYLYHNNATASNAKVGIYADDGNSTPDENDTSVVVSDSITGGTSTGWKTSSASLGGSVTNGSNYWICTMVESGGNTFVAKSGDGAGAYYILSSGFYASPPANLGGSWDSLSESPISVYVNIE